MRSRGVAAVLLGVASASACLVPTFNVGPLPDGKGGSEGGENTSGNGATSSGATSAGVTSGGVTNGGKATAEAGHAGNGSGLAGSGTGGSNPVTGMAGAAGDDGASGAAGAGGGGGGALGPYRVGFSVFHDSANGNDNASSHLEDATFSKPAGTAAGDFMLVFFGSDHFLAHMGASELLLRGWTLQEQHSGYGSDGQATYLAYKFAGTSEPDSIVFQGINNPVSGNGVQGLLSVYRGVDMAAPINDYQFVVVDTGSSASMHVETATHAITSTVDNCLLIAGLSPDSYIDAPTVSSWPAGFDQNHVSVTNPTSPMPYGWANIYSAERSLAKAGTVPASFFGWEITYGGKDYYGAFTFVLALAPAP